MDERPGILVTAVEKGARDEVAGRDMRGAAVVEAACELSLSEELMDRAAVGCDNDAPAPLPLLAEIRPRRRRMPRSVLPVPLLPAARIGSEHVAVDYGKDRHWAFGRVRGCGVGGRGCL